MLTDSIAQQPKSATNDRFDSAVRSLLHLPTWVWLTVSGLLMAGIYYFAFGARFRWSDYGQLPQQNVALINKLSPEGAVLFLGSFAALFFLYWMGSRQKLETSRLHWILIAGFPVIFSLALLPMYTVDAADVYDYIIRGRMSSVYGLNPLSDTPNSVKQDPFYDFTAWKTVPSAYGPAWEALSNVVTRLAGDDPWTNVVAYKLISLAGTALPALFIALTLQQLAPRRMLLGVYLFAWNPLVIYISAGNAHNDTVMTACMLLSVYCLARRWYTASTLAALLGALVKFVPILMIPIIGVVALRSLKGSERLRYLACAGILSIALAVAFFAPYWTGGDPISLSRRERMFTSSVGTLVHQYLQWQHWDEGQAVQLISYTTFGLLGLFLLSELFEVWQQPDVFRAIRAIIAVLLFYLLVSIVWFQNWYVVWVVALAALLDNTPMRRFVLFFSYIVTWQSFLYYYVTLRYDGWSPLPWRDLIPVAVFIGLPWAYVIWFWVSTWYRRLTRTPLAIAVGERLRQAREAAQLSPVDLAEQVSIPTDDVWGYEDGTRTLPINRAAALAERLNLSLQELVAPPTPPISNA